MKQRITDWKSCGILTARMYVRHCRSGRIKRHVEIFCTAHSPYAYCTPVHHLSLPTYSSVVYNYKHCGEYLGLGATLCFSAGGTSIPVAGTLFATAFECCSYVCHWNVVHTAVWNLITSPMSTGALCIYIGQRNKFP